MSSVGQGRPPPLPPRASKQRVRVRARTAKPPAIEWLPEEYVHEAIDAYELLPDEFVIEEESPFVFAGPSDPPPRLQPPTKPMADAPRSRLRGERSRRSSMRTLWPSAAAGAACLLAMARFTASAPAQSATASAHPAAASPMPVSAPETDDSSSSLVAASSENSPWRGSSAFSSFGDVPAAGEGASPAPAREALEKKQASQQALEKGKLALSIELGERAVELDPTDGDSWLILGAAYLQRRDIKNARRCFSSCVTQATSGQRKECVAMLR
jgi:hypothetical protein